MIKTLLDGILDLIYPPHCLICQDYLIHDSSKGMLCPACFEKLKPNQPPFCLKCSRHLPRPIKHPQCKTCRKLKPSFDFAWSAYQYNEEMKRLIHQFKYHQKIQLRFLFSILMQKFLNSYCLDTDQFDLIMPVPLFSSRLRERGFNQAELLGQQLFVDSQQRLSTNYLIRIRNTQYQSLFGQKERFTNIHGAFRIKHSDQVDNKTILIIDDLLTTGATTSEIARILRQAGAKRIGVLTLATA